MRTRVDDWLHRSLATPAIPVVIAIALGLWRAGDKSIWLDEAVSVEIARLPTLDMLVHLWRIELHAAPYYMALHPWLALGDSESAVRALSVVIGVAAVFATWAIGRRYGVAFKAALVLAVLPAFVRYEQEARGYTLLMAASAVATLLFLRLLERPDRWRVLAYVVAAGGMIYVHPLGALVIVAHALGVLLLQPTRRSVPLLAVFIPVGVLWLPMLRFAALNRERISWIPPTTIELATGELLQLAGGALAAVALVALLVLGMRRDLLALWLLVPILGTIAISLLIQPTLQERYLVSALPAAALIAARNRTALVLGLATVSLVSSWGWYEDRSAKDDWRGAAAWVSARVEPGDGIVFSPHYVRAPFGYYARVADPLWPAEPWSESDLYAGTPDPMAFAGARRVWLVEAHSPALPPEVRAALGRFSTVESHVFAGPQRLRVTLLAAPGAGAAGQPAGNLPAP